MRRWTRASVPLAVTLTAAGCAGSEIFQQPLARDQPVRPQTTDTNLVLGGGSPQDDWTARRNDGPGDTQRPVYYGPGGTLHYEDGSPVRYDSVRKQLQELRAEERIGPR